MFSSFERNPQRVYFDNQRNGEQLYLLMRRHFITNLSWIVGAGVMLFLPIPLYAGVVFLAPDFVGSLDPLFTLLLTLLWYAIIFTFVMEEFLLWYFQVYIVTDTRLVDIDFHGLFYKEFSEAQLTKVQDVTSEVQGPIQVLFNYGLFTAQTAAEQTEIQFEDVPTPDAVSKLVGELVAAKGGSLSVRDK